MNEKKTATQAVVGFSISTSTRRWITQILLLSIGGALLLTGGDSTIAVSLMVAGGVGVGGSAIGALKGGR